MYNLQTLSIRHEEESETEKVYDSKESEDEFVDEERSVMSMLSQDSGDEGSSEATSEEEIEDEEKEGDDLEFLVSGKRIEEVHDMFFANVITVFFRESVLVQTLSILYLYCSQLLKNKSHAISISSCSKLISLLSSNSTYIFE